MNYFKLYMGDYQRDTGALSISEHGAYFLMLQYHYATEKPLPKGKDLYRLLRCESKADRNAVDSVVSRYWSETPVGLINGRSTKEIAKADNQRTINREVGKLGGRPKVTETKPNDNRIGYETVTETKPNDNPNQTPDTRHQSNSNTKVKSRTSAQSAKAPMSLRLGEGQVLETIPLIGEAIAEVCQTHLEELERLYPGVDPLPTLREIRGWNLANPTRRKTSRGIASHINAWFQRDQNRS